MRVLFVTTDRLARQRSGVAVRCLELARVLAAQHEVTIASTQPSDLTLSGIRLLPEADKRRSELRALARESDVVITQGMSLAKLPFLSTLARHLVIDLYDPFLFEYLEHAHPVFPSWGYLRQWNAVNQQLLRGDFFLCANQRQWDYWLGRLCALGRLNPEEYKHDPSFARLLSVVPFGLPAAPPKKTASALRGVVPGIGNDDFVMLWAGGIWQWFDPLTIIRAVAEASRERSDLRLYFLGTQDPNPSNRPMPLAAECRKQAQELGVLDRSVFFSEGWVPYEDRQNYLLEADVGVSAHPATLESRFAFRTRVLDYIWSALPMMLSEGDHFGEWVRQERAGWTLAPGDVAGWKAAILAAALDPAGREAMRGRLRALAPGFAWERVAGPLLKYCATPYRTHRLPRWRKGLAPWLSAAYERGRALRG